MIEEPTNTPCPRCGEKLTQIVPLPEREYSCPACGATFDDKSLFVESAAPDTAALQRFADVVRPETTIICNDRREGAQVVVPPEMEKALHWESWPGTAPGGEPVPIETPQVIDDSERGYIQKLRPLADDERAARMEETVHDLWRRKYAGGDPGDPAGSDE